MDRIGEWTTYDGAAKFYHTTYWAVVGFVRRRNVVKKKIGRTTLVKLSDLTELKKER